MKGTKRDQGDKMRCCLEICELFFWKEPSGTKGEKGSSSSSSKFTESTRCPTEFPGQDSMKGEKRNGGTVYVRWGHDQCPSTAQLVYSGRAGGPYYSHTGGGSNPQCLLLDPNFLTATVLVEIMINSGLTCMELNMKLTLTVTVIFMDVITLMYYVQFVMSAIVLQSTWFLLSTHALQDGRPDQRVLWIPDG